MTQDWIGSWHALRKDARKREDHMHCVTEGSTAGCVTFRCRWRARRTATAGSCSNALLRLPEK